MRLSIFLPFCIALVAPVSYGQPKSDTVRVLFDFENAGDPTAWSNLELPDAKDKELPAKWELSAEYATSGKHSLKITFSGGRWPTITTTNIPDDWTAYETFKADVTVNRPCLVGFTVLQENSRRGGDWDGAVSRWCKTQLLKAGTNEVSENLHPNGWSAIRTKLENGKVLGKVIRFEIFMYKPRAGESIYVDNIRLLTMKEKTLPPPKTQFQVLGADLTVSNVQELSKKLADRWIRPKAQTVDEVEAEFRAQYRELKKKHPAAVLAVFRDGDRGFDPAHPDKIFAGWKDAYWSSHGPDGMTVERGTNYGKHATQEIFMRHRSPLFRVDLSSIPKGAHILAAKLLIVRAGDYAKEHTPLKPNMWVAEACNRPWDEYEVNGYEYAKDKFWKAIGGMHWADDPDFLPVYLAHGPSQPGVCTWDFRHAVDFWVNGKHANHGFMLHGDSRDWFRAWFREAEKVQNRPALLVVFESKV